MAEPFLTIDDLTEHLGNLPDWYVQVLEERERNACDVCPEDEIEIELTDFSGRPISGEPWFVFMENTNGSAVSTVNTDVDPFLNGAGQTTPSPLILNPGTHVLDIAFGGQTPMTLNLRDAGLGEDYEEQLFVIDTPVEYEGPLSYPGPASAPEIAAYGDLRGVISAYEADVPNDALQDMLAEIETALRAAVGIFPDLSLTARNDAEHKLVMGMQMVPINAHQHPAVVPMYQDAMTTFNDRREVAPFGFFFVGPDGVSYEDPHGDVATSAGEEEANWYGIGAMLDMLQGYSSSFRLYAQAALESPHASSVRIAQAARIGGYQVAGPPSIPRNQIRGGRNNYPSRGAGSNPKTKPTGRNGVQAHAQAQARRPVKSEGKHKFHFLTKIKIDGRTRQHVHVGDGLSGTTSKGGHQHTNHLHQLRDAGRQTENQVIATHPNNGGIRGNRYRVMRSDDTWSNWRIKTTYTFDYNTALTMAKQAFNNYSVNRLNRRQSELPPGKWRGVTRNGVQMEGFVRDGHMESFMFTKWWP